MQTRYDLAIIGSGGGAFAAAIRATTLGKSVVMVERGTFGGTCVNTGCVPSKALIAAAEARHVAADAPTRFPGIASVAGAVDMPALIGGKQDLVEALRGEKYVDVADSYGWQVRRGNAAFAGTPDSPLLEVAAGASQISPGPVPGAPVTRSTSSTARMRPSGPSQPWPGGLSTSWPSPSPCGATSGPRSPRSAHRRSARPP